MRTVHVLPNDREGNAQRNVARLGGAQGAAGHDAAVAGAARSLRHVFPEPRFDVPTVSPLRLRWLDRVPVLGRRTGLHSFVRAVR